jgi:hypothetical protein
MDEASRECGQAVAALAEPSFPGHAPPETLRRDTRRGAAPADRRAAAGNAGGDRNAPDDFIDNMLRGIIGLEIPIRRLVCKWKLSQNGGSCASGS